MNSFFEAAHQLESSQTPFVVVTVIAHRGHAPQDPGAKAIVTCAGLQWGTVGGGKVEAKAILFARELLQIKHSRRSLDPLVLTWNLQRDVGMSCGGEMTVLFELHDVRQWQIAVFGAGHVAQATVEILTKLKCHVTCVDPRMEWLERLPECVNLTRRHQSDLASAVVDFAPETYFIVMTQGHATDLPVLEAILKRPLVAPYVGVLGSDIKAKKIRQDLLECGVDLARVEVLRCPMGLPLGSNDPFEIAISIVGEILQRRDSLASPEGGPAIEA